LDAARLVNDRLLDGRGAVGKFEANFLFTLRAAEHGQNQSDRQREQSWEADLFSCAHNYVFVFYFRSRRG
jgi:hypothetical protein